MDHIDMKPDQPPMTKWGELLALLLIAVVFVVAYGIVGNMDYSDSVTQERNELRVKLQDTRSQLALAMARCGEACSYQYVQSSLAQQQEGQ